MPHGPLVSAAPKTELVNNLDVLADATGYPTESPEATKGVKMVATSRTDQHRADQTKAEGIVYTPRALAQFLAAQAFDALGDVRAVRILDPACGDGELLLAAMDRAKLRNVHVDELVGYDINEAAVSSAASRLAGIHQTRLYCTDFLEVVARSRGMKNLFESDNGSDPRNFTMVISNPPYVRTQTLGAQVAQTLGERFGLSGRVDLYQAFAAAMIGVLSPGGALALLCSNKFLTTLAGASMRRLLLEEMQLRELVDLGDTKLFDVSVLPVIVSGSRKTGADSGEPTLFRSVYEADSPKLVDRGQDLSVLQALANRREGLVRDGNRTFAIRSGLLDRDVGADNPWNLVDNESKKLFELIRRSSATTLEHLGKIRVGVKTTADAVFIRSDWDKLPDKHQPEPTLLRPLLTHDDVQPWSARPGGRRILYPHCDHGGRAVAVDLKRFPRAASYLESHRERLESRQYLIDSGRNWYEVWVPQRPALWGQQKLVFPDIAESPRFAIDQSGAIVNGDCYWILVEDDDLADVIAAVGNSSFCTWFYDRACGNHLYAKRRRFMAQYVKRLPIPKPTPSLVSVIRELRAAKDICGLDSIIWSSLGLEQPTR